MTDVGRLITAPDMEELEAHLGAIQLILSRGVGVPPETDTIVRPAPILPPAQAQFKLSATSIGKLAFLLPPLRNVVTRAIAISEVDFGVSETIRTVSEQHEEVAAGRSRTMQSKHLAQADGFSHAVDLFAWINGKVDWTPIHYGHIAHAMFEAAKAKGVAEHVRWGGAWDRVLSDFNDKTDFEQETHLYAARHAGSDLIDMPHFEWV